MARENSTLNLMHQTIKHLYKELGYFQTIVEIASVFAPAEHGIG